MEDEVLFTMDSLEIEPEVNAELEEIKEDSNKLEIGNDNPFSTDKKEAPKEDAQSSNKEEIYQALFDEIKSSAGLTETEQKIKSLEDIQAILKESYDKKGSSTEGLSDVQIEYLEHLKAGVPQETIQQQLSFDDQINKITDDSLDTDEELRKNIIYQGLVVGGMSEERASKQVDLIVKSGADIEMSKEYLGDLKDYSKKTKDATLKEAQANQLKIEKAQQDYYNTLKGAVEDPKEFIGETKLTKELQANMLKTLTDPVDYNGNQVTELNKYFEENPAKANVILSYFYNITDKFNAEKIASLNPNKATAKATNKLDTLLQGNADDLLTGDRQDNLMIDNNGKEINLDKVMDFLNN